MRHYTRALRNVGFISEKGGLNLEYAKLLKSNPLFNSWVDVWKHEITIAREWLIHTYFKDKPLLAKRYSENKLSPEQAEVEHRKGLTISSQDDSSEPNQGAVYPDD